VGHDISIDETIKDKKSWFNIKRFKIGNADFQKPEKSLDSKSLTQDVYSLLVNPKDFKFSELTKIIPKYSVVSDIFNESDDTRINQFFGKRSWLAEVPSVVNLTFEFNPFRSIEKIEKMSAFFDLYYQYSKLFLSIPNIRTVKGYSKNKVQIIDLKDYIRFVDSVYEILNTKNNKPIFVPISLRLSAPEIVELVSHYLKKQRYYYWFDFEGKPINEAYLGRLRHLFRHLEEKTGYFDKAIFYFTNVRREITSNLKSNISPASDVLCALAGANIVGVDREPKRFNPEGPPAPPPPPEHKARLLDNDSYYYVKTRDRNMFAKEKYVTHNSIAISKELTRQSNTFLKNRDLEKFLQQKPMLNEYKEGSILKELLSKNQPDQQDLGDWFG
jgi:hypothetical protein